MKNRNLLSLFIICFALFVIALLLNFHQDFTLEEKRNKEVHLIQFLDQSVRILDRELDKISIFVSSFKSHVVQAETELNPEKAFEFIKEQLAFLDYSENIIINFVDSDHNFVYSVGTQKKEVNNLAGTSVTKIRNQEVIDKLDAFLQSDDILAFSPINLYEGYAGLPINFRFKLNDEVKGYFAIIVDVKNLLIPIVESDINDEFTFKFLASDDSIEYDREKVYDGTKTYNMNSDSDNLRRNREEYAYQNTLKIGMPFSIGVDYKDEEVLGNIANFIYSILGILLFLIFSTSLLFYLFYQNIQKSKQQEVINTKLNKSNELLKKFIFASSHDLKQPIVNISNFRGLLVKNHENNFDESAKKYLDVIDDNVNHMSDVLDDLLIYSNLISEEKTKQKIEITEVIEFITEPYDKEKINVNFDHLLPCYGVKSEITRLFQNLIDNAIKYNQSEVKEISISSRDIEGFIEYKIVDNGIGIKEEYRELVFSEFQRIDKKNFKGTGLGLSICKEIVLNHGGKIEIDGVKKGGSLITFSIAKNV